MPQSLSNVLAHLVFSTAHRDPLISDEIRSELYPYMSGILSGEEHRVLQLGGIEDHVHVLFALARTDSVSDTVKRLKSRSTVWVKDRFNTRFAWQAGYGIFSIGQGEVQAAVQYIQNQRAHHHNLSFQDEYRELMRLADLPLDERYAWD